MAVSSSPQTVTRCTWRRRLLSRLRSIRLAGGIWGVGPNGPVKMLSPAKGTLLGNFRLVFGRTQRGRRSGHLHHQPSPTVRHRSEIEAPVELISAIVDCVDNDESAPSDFGGLYHLAECAKK